MSTASWYQWTGAGWAAVPGDPRAQSVVLGQTATITDATGVAWALANVNFGQVTRNNVTDTSSNNVTELAYVGGVMWRFVSSTGLWSSWANGSLVITSSPAGQSFTDASGNVWTIVSGVDYKNGAPAGSTGNVIELADVGGVIWTENSSGQWYSWNGTTWTAGPAPAIVVGGWSAGTRTSPLGTITRNPWEHPGGAGSCWNTPIGLGAVVGLNTDLDTIDIARGWNGTAYTDGPVGNINIVANNGCTSYVGALGEGQYNITTNNNGRNSAIAIANGLLDTGASLNATLYIPTGAISGGPYTTPVALTAVQNLVQLPNPTTTTMQMSWGAPVSGSASTYNLQYSVGGTNTFLRPVMGISGTSYTITNLTGATLYIIQVQAVDANGIVGPWATTGAWSTAATDSPVSNETPPGPPINVIGTIITNSIGETYVMTARSGGGPNQLTVNGSIDPFIDSVGGAFTIVYQNHTVFVATGGTTVYAKVAAVEPWTRFTALGGIPFVAPPIDLTHPGTPPSAVNSLGVAALVGNPTTTSIQWLWGNPSTGTGPFTYLIAVKLHSNPNFPTLVLVSYTSNSTTYLSTGLTASTQYDVEVAAIDVWGQQGPFAIAGPLSTAATAPIIPSAPSGSQNVAVGYLGGTLQVTYVGSTTNFAVYYDIAYYNSSTGPAAGNIVLSVCESALAFVKARFGNIYSVSATTTPQNPSGTMINVFLSNHQGGAANHGFGNADIVTSIVGSDTASNYGFLIVAELSEDFMGMLGGLSAYEDIYALGEGLSQQIGYLAYTNVTSIVGYGPETWLDYVAPGSGAFSVRPDYVNSSVLSASVNGQSAISCNLHFINWLRHKGYTFSQIFAAINASAGPATGRLIYNQLVSGTTVDPFPLFTADVSVKYPVGANLNSGTTSNIGPFFSKFPGADLWQTPVV